MHLPLDRAEEAEWSAAVSGTEGLVEATAVFLEEVQALPNLIAVLTGARKMPSKSKTKDVNRLWFRTAGHIHDNNANHIGRAVQYTTDAGCYSGCRILHFEPTSHSRL